MYQGNINEYIENLDRYVYENFGKHVRRYKMRGSNDPNNVGISVHRPSPNGMSIYSVGSSLDDDIEEKILQEVKKELKITK